MPTFHEMATITIRNLPERVKTKLRILAAEHGRSMEAEARIILSAAVRNHETSPESKGELRFEHLIGIWEGRHQTDELMRDLRGDD